MLPVLSATRPTTTSRGGILINSIRMTGKAPRVSQHALNADVDAVHLICDGERAVHRASSPGKYDLRRTQPARSSGPRAQVHRDREHENFLEYTQTSTRSVNTRSEERARRHYTGGQRSAPRMAALGISTTPTPSSKLDGM